MTLLTIVQTAYDRLLSGNALANPRPTAVVSSTDGNTRLLYALANEEGRALHARFPWQAVTAEHTFTTVAAAVQTGGLPADFDRYLPDTMYNRTTNRAVAGPVSAAEWQGIQSSLVTRIDPAFRIRGNALLLTPTPAAGGSVYYEYVSTKWAQSSGSTAQTSFLADDDTARLSEDLITLGVIWRFRRSKQLDYAEEFSQYETRVTEAMQNDGAKPRITVDSRTTRMPRKPCPPQAPETLVF